ncbi:hypothetical protein MTO96_012379 [Rhipicephalus appendiculatus]
MTAPIAMDSGSTPGDATTARRPEVVIRGLDRRGYEYIGETPINELKVFRGSSRTAGFNATFTFVLKTLVLILLKLNFVFMLLRYLYWLPRMSMNSLPEALFEISEVILSLAAVAGGESLWSYKSNMALLSSRYFEASEAGGGFEPGQGSLRPPSFWHDKLVRLLLFGHALLGLSLCFVSSFPSWTTMLCATEELQLTYQSITHDALSRLHWKWEQCCRYLGDISNNFLRFVCTWYCYLFVRAVYLITLLCTALLSASGGCLTRDQLYVPMFELTYLLVLCFISDTLKATLLSPVEHLRELTLSRPTSEVAIHVEVQRFVYRIYKYLSMTLLKLSTWTETALKAFGLLIVALLVLHGKRDHAKAKGVRVPTVAEGRWAALVARQTVAPAQVQEEAEVFGESNDEGASGQTRESLVVEPAENESAADLLAASTVECGLTQADDEDAHPAPSASVALVSGTTPECVGERPSDRNDCVQVAAPTQRKKLQLKPRSVPVEAKEDGAAVPKAAKLAPNAPSYIFGGARPVDTAAREREIEARLARQREEEARRRIRHREPFQDSRKDDWVRRSSVASGSGRPQRFSESGRDSYDDGGRQPSSQQCSNDSRHRSQSGSHGSQAGCDATVRDEPGDSPKTPPADRIRRPDFAAKHVTFAESVEKFLATPQDYLILVATSVKTFQGGAHLFPN